MNVITEWMDGWGVLIKVKTERSYTVSLDEEVTPLPKSHDTGTDTRTGSQCVCVCEINIIHYYANNSFMLYHVNSYKAYLGKVRLQLQ